MPDTELDEKSARIRDLLRNRNNWGRWGADDEKGALNLITPERRVAAASLVRSGHAFSLSRPFPKTPGPTNLRPAQHYVTRDSRGVGGISADYIGLDYHGLSCTHLDGLCHTWDDAGMWNGRDPDAELTTSGSRWAGIDAWSDGIFTRGVLLNIPKHRGAAFVTQESPVHGQELADICAGQDLQPQAGDALVIYSGREEWDRVSERPWGVGDSRPGLHASCLEFIREVDCSVIVWDMLDMMPTGISLPWSVHAAIFAFGVGLIDNSLLEPLAAYCDESNRTDFLLTAAPLPVAGGTGSPLNPIAVF